MYGAAAIATDVMFGSRSRQRYSTKESPVLQHSSADFQPTVRSVDQESIRPITGIPDLWLAVAAAAFVGLIATFSMHLINLRMQRIGISGSAISWSVAIQA